MLARSRHTRIVGGRFWRHAAALALSLAAVAHSPSASAKSGFESGYSFQQTFGSALRLIKVDMDFEVTETNSEWGYFLFKYKSPEAGKRTPRGSFQFVRDDGKVSVNLELTSMPSYHERIIITKLQRKLRDEHGEAPRRKAKKRKRRDDDRDDDKRDDDKRDGDERDGDKRDDESGSERRRVDLRDKKRRR
jgi:hypothetical protein